MFARPSSPQLNDMLMKRRRKMSRMAQWNREAEERRSRVDDEQRSKEEPVGSPTNFLKF